MKIKTLIIVAMIAIAVVAFTGWMESVSPLDVRADAVNAENLIFTYIDAADTTAAGDSVLTVSAMTTADEIRFALKLLKTGAPDSVDHVVYTDSLTKGAGTLTPATWTYDDDYLIIWRDVNP